MIKVTIYDWINAPDEIAVFEGTREDVEIHLRSKFLSDCKGIALGALTEILQRIGKKFGIHVEAWEKVI
jgi:hypothetical protein